MSERGDHSRKQPAAPERRREMRRSYDRRLLHIEMEAEATRQVREVLFEELDSGDVIERSLEVALDVVDAEGGSVIVVGQNTDELACFHFRGKYPRSRQADTSWRKGIVGTVFESGTPVIIRDMSAVDGQFDGAAHHTDGSTRDLAVVPLKWRGGNPVGVLEVLNKRNGRFDERDLSLLMVVAAISANAIERARLYEEVKLAEVARLLGNVSHDIKNLLTPVVYGTEVLDEETQNLFRLLGEREDNGLDRSRRRCRSTIASLYGSSRRIQDRVKEISDCIKGLSTAPSFGPCSVESIVLEVLEALRLSSQRKGLQMECRGLDALPEIRADERRLFSCFYNLVNNAIPEVPRGGTVTVSGEEVPSQRGVLISVIDNGRGMPAEIRDSLFTDRAQSRKRLGTGLGTRIVRDVAEAHGGQVSVESEIGRGTTVRILLPLDPGSSSS